MTIERAIKIFEGWRRHEQFRSTVYYEALGRSEKKVEDNVAALNLALRALRRMQGADGAQCNGDADT